jgi:Cu/Ag efflux protein CusF
MMNADVSSNRRVSALKPRTVPGTKRIRGALLPRTKPQESAMKTATASLAAIAVVALSLSAAAEQGVTGMVTAINRLNNTIAIQRTQGGTVGTNAPRTTEEFKIKDNAMIENVHAGDRVTFSTSDSGSTKTITKLDRQK